MDFNPDSDSDSEYLSSRQQERSRKAVRHPRQKYDDPDIYTDKSAFFGTQDQTSDLRRLQLSSSRNRHRKEYRDDPNQQTDWRYVSRQPNPRSQSVDRRGRVPLRTTRDPAMSEKGTYLYQESHEAYRPLGPRSHSVSRRSVAVPNNQQRYNQTINYPNVRGGLERGRPDASNVRLPWTQRDGRQGPNVPFSQRNQCQDKDSWEICMRNLSDRRCMFGRNCRRHHCNETYQWQYKDVAKEDDLWHNFNRETNTDIEMNYCQPDKDDCHIRFWRGEIVNIIFFEEGMYGEGETTRLELRRLSTISSENFSGPLSIWTTVWRWYWEDPDSEGWSEYGAEDKYGSRSSLTSDVLENKYQENPKASISFETNNFEYTVNFERMCQENIRMSTQRRVRRRPKFFRREDLKNRKIQSRSGIQTPKGWNIGRSSEEEFCKYYNRVEVEPRTSEYRKVYDLFNETMKGTRRIMRIERIENGDLWMSYKQKQLQMKRKSGGTDANEMSLFHGTQTDLIEPICRQGFDFRFSGANVGTLYGRGSYFAREAKYSDCYAQANMDGTKQIFAAKVLVGEYTRGDKSFVRPPAKCLNNPYDLFDSCTDSERDPKIFVIFTLEQVYPEYLITYS